MRHTITRVAAILSVLSVAACSSQAGTAEPVSSDQAQPSVAAEASSATAETSASTSDSTSVSESPTTEAGSKPRHLKFGKGVLLSELPDIDGLTMSEPIALTASTWLLSWLIPAGSGEPPTSVVAAINEHSGEVEWNHSTPAGETWLCGLRPGGNKQLTCLETVFNSSNDPEESSILTVDTSDGSVQDSVDTIPAFGVATWRATAGLVVLTGDNRGAALVDPSSGNVVWELGEIEFNGNYDGSSWFMNANGSVAWVPEASSKDGHSFTAVVDVESGSVVKEAVGAPVAFGSTVCVGYDSSLPQTTDIADGSVACFDQEGAALWSVEGQLPRVSLTDERAAERFRNGVSLPAGFPVLTLSGGLRGHDPLTGDVLWTAPNPADILPVAPQLVMYESEGSPPVGLDAATGRPFGGTSGTSESFVLGTAANSAVVGDADGFTGVGGADATTAWFGEFQNLDPRPTSDLDVSAGDNRVIGGESGPGTTWVWGCPDGLVFGAETSSGNAIWIATA